MGYKARIEAAEVIPVSFDLGTSAYGSARGLVEAREATLVRLVLDSGTEGWGEAFGPVAAMPSLVQELTNEIVGLRLDGPTSLLANRRIRLYHRGSGLNTAAMSAVDCALWDACARELGVSICDVLGGKVRNAIRVYGSCGYVTNDNGREQFAAVLEEQIGGLEAAKIKGGLGREEDVERAKTARSLLGPNGTLMVDFNCNYSYIEAARTLESLRQFDLYWVEEPIPYAYPEALSGLRHFGVPIAVGESLYSRAEFARLACLHLADVLQPDVAKCGGISELRNLGELAGTWGCSFSPHVWGTAIGLAATLQVLASLPPTGQVASSRDLWLELDRGQNALRECLLVEPIVLKDGCLAVPEGPGLGVEVDRERVESLRWKGASR